MLAMPPKPMVSASHSMSPCSTMMPNAIVTIARYGPLTRSDASASTTPTAAPSSAATGSAVQKPRPSRVARIAPA